MEDSDSNPKIEKRGSEDERDEVEEKKEEEEESLYIHERR